MSFQLFYEQRNLCTFKWRRICLNFLLSYAAFRSKRPELCRSFIDTSPQFEVKSYP
jgi:hypothetical protein